MSRVKMWMTICAVMIMALAVGTSGALASTIDFDSTHSFYITILNQTSSTYLAPISGNITTAFTDYATTNPDEGVSKSTGPTAIAINTPSSVTASQAGETWLLSRTDTTSYSGPQQGNTAYGGGISHNFTAEGPDPGSNTNGTVGQANLTSKTQLLKLVYTVPTAGSYLIGFSDTYSSTRSVNQATGSDFPVSCFNGFSEIHVKIAGPGIGSDNFLTLYDELYGAMGSSSPIASFTDSVVDHTITLGPFNPTLATGTLTLDVYLTSYYDAETTLIPVPPTVLLLGSGLLGLGLLRRKWSLRK